MIRVKVEHPLLPSGTNNIIELEASQVKDLKDPILATFGTLRSSSWSEYQIRLVDASMKKLVRENPGRTDIFEWAVDMNSTHQLAQTVDPSDPQRYIIFFEQKNPKGGLTDEEIRLWNELKVKASTTLIANKATEVIKLNDGVVITTPTVKVVKDDGFDVEPIDKVDEDYEDEEDDSNDSDDDDNW